MTVLSQLTAALAVLTTAVIYGFDVFAALVLGPALAKVDDRSLTSVMGNVHSYGDRRLAIPSVLSLLSAVLTTVFAAIAGDGGAAVTAGVAAVAIAGWLAIYGRVSAPINRELTKSAQAGEIAPQVRGLQKRWDGVILPRLALQTIAMVGLLAALALH
jgi:hypothetical protein